MSAQHSPVSPLTDDTQGFDPGARELYEGLLERWPERPFRPYGKDMLHAVVATILSQRTTYRNQRLAHDRLWDTFGSWEAIAQAPVEEIQRCIASSTYPENKAPVIRSFLQKLHELRGSFDLEFLADWDVHEAYNWITQFKGLGPKTASFSLLFHLGKPILPVDTHVGRVSERYGLIPKKASNKRAHDLLNAMMPQGDTHIIYNYHRVLFDHGRRICTFRRPNCAACPVQKTCAYGQSTGA